MIRLKSSNFCSPEINSCALCPKVMTIMICLVHFTLENNNTNYWHLELLTLCNFQILKI